ncbi:unnamed protein product [Mytilus coruscus]|uniref:Macro domain-containing protein n=1 Tax=Mytilus coruscus TaxID=42192 RepID=A0A6J8CP53_MYTCO|nr:unnamed protein product [Mytilus coruscus]
MMKHVKLHTTIFDTHYKKLGTQLIKDNCNKISLGRYIFKSPDKVHHDVVCFLSQWDFGLIDQNYRNISFHKDTRENRIIWFKQCLERLKELKVKTVGLPAHISCGLGGGDWTAYFQIINNFAKANDINFILYCYGCTVHHPSQIKHTCLMWNELEHLVMHFEEALSHIDHKAVRTKWQEEMKKLEQSDWTSCHTVDISEHARDTCLKLLDDVECKMITGQFHALRHIDQKQAETVLYFGDNSTILGLKVLATEVDNDALLQM